MTSNTSQKNINNATSLSKRRVIRNTENIHKYMTIITFPIYMRLINLDLLNAYSLKYYLDNGIIDVDWKCSSGLSMLMKASYSQEVEVVEILVSKYVKDINYKYQGLTALRVLYNQFEYYETYEEKLKQVEIAKILIINGSEIDDDVIRETAKYCPSLNTLAVIYRIKQENMLSYYTIFKFEKLFNELRYEIRNSIDDVMSIINKMTIGRDNTDVIKSITYNNKITDTQHFTHE